jgi:hypothetical protein
MRRVGIEMLRAIGGGLQAGFGAMGGAAATVAVAAAASHQEKGGKTDEVLALAIAPGLATAATQLVVGITDAFGKSRLSEIEAQRLTHEKYKADSASSLSTRPLNVQDPVMRIDAVLARIFALAKKGEVVDTARVKRLLRWRQEFLLALPDGPKTVEQWRTRAGRKSLVAEIKKVLITFPEQLRPTLESVLIRIAANSVTTGAERRRLQFKLKGPGGTGKDTFIGIIEKLFGIPVIEFTIPIEREGGVQSLMPRSFVAIDQEYPATDEDLFGKLGLSLLKSGYDNTIVFLNEIKLDEKGVVNGLKKLLDPENAVIKIRTLETEISWTGQTVIGATNDDDNDEALNTRWETILFSETTRDTKRKAALEMFELEALNYSAILDDGEAVLNVTEQKRLKSSFLFALDTLLDEHEKRMPGARMDFARSLTTYIAVGLIEGGAKSGKEILDFVLDHYKDMSSTIDKKPPAPGLNKKDKEAWKGNPFA